MRAGGGSVAIDKQVSGCEAGLELAQACAVRSS